jgi:hypothetical protein
MAHQRFAAIYSRTGSKCTTLVPRCCHGCSNADVPSSNARQLVAGATKGRFLISLLSMPSRPGRMSGQEVHFVATWPAAKSRPTDICDPPTSACRTLIGNSHAVVRIAALRLIGWRALPVPVVRFDHTAGPPMKSMGGIAICDDQLAPRRTMCSGQATPYRPPLNSSVAGSAVFFWFSVFVIWNVSDRATTFF